MKLENQMEISNNEKDYFEIFSPIDGTIISLENIPDETFSRKLIGDGIGIKPNGNILYAPCDSDIINIFDAVNAASFKVKNGLDILVHIGVDTIKLEGKGFTKLNDKTMDVKKGEALISFDQDFINKNSKSDKTAIVISNMEIVEKIEFIDGEVKKGDLLMKVYLKK
jgi:glucose-specific phosphotransferase system IIA component